MRVAILGAGLAGVAAAWAARRAGADVTVFDGGPGSSALSCGAVDDAPWESAAAPWPQLTGDVAAFVDVLGLLAVGEGPARVATRAGVLRPARGRDRSLLDVAGLADATVAVARVRRPSWDATLLARGLADEPWARAHRVRFVPVDVDALRHDDEHTLPDVDLAARHDDPERAAWLARSLRKARERDPFDAVLFGPWLGARTTAAEAVTTALGAPVGETTSGPGGSAGARLASRLRALATENARVVRGTRRLDVDEGVPRVIGPDGEEPFDAAVLAVGGAISAGVTLVRSDPTVVGGTPPRFAFPACDDAILAWGRDDECAAWAAETPLPPLGWTVDGPSPLERAGVLHARLHLLPASRKPEPRVLVAGDAAFGTPRTLLSAIRSGLEAGARAAAR